jgi:hypothetical protein
MPAGAAVATNVAIVPRERGSMMRLQRPSAGKSEGNAKQFIPGYSPDKKVQLGR